MTGDDDDNGHHDIQTIKTKTKCRSALPPRLRGMTSLKCIITSRGSRSLMIMITTSYTLPLTTLWLSSDAVAKWRKESRGERRLIPFLVAFTISSFAYLSPLVLPGLESWR